jgi:hypothetical protein
MRPSIVAAAALLLLSSCSQQDGSGPPRDPASARESLRLDYGVSASVPETAWYVARLPGGSFGYDRRGGGRIARPAVSMRPRASVLFPLLAATDEIGDAAQHLSMTVGISETKMDVSKARDRNAEALEAEAEQMDARNRGDPDFLGRVSYAVTEVAGFYATDYVSRRVVHPASGGKDHVQVMHSLEVFTPYGLMMILVDYPEDEAARCKPEADAFLRSIAWSR